MSRPIVSRSVPVEMKAHVLGRSDYRCHYCGRGLTFEGAHIDHAVPRSRGGFTVTENLRASCSECNLEKGDRTEAEYFLWQACRITFTSSVAEMLSILRTQKIH